MRQRMVGGMAIAGLVLGGAGVLRGEVIEPTESVEGSSATEIEYTTCNHGVLRECGTSIEQRCTQFVASSGSGSLGFAPGSGSVSGSVSGSCISYTNITVKLYKDRYKPKA